MTSKSGRKRLPVLTYLILIFGASVMALAGLVATTTLASFKSERHRVTAALRSGADLAATSHSDGQRQTADFPVPIAGQPAAWLSDQTA